MTTDARILSALRSNADGVSGAELSQQLGVSRAAIWARVEELRQLTEGLVEEVYQWDIGEVKSAAGPVPITYLIGVPIDT